MPARIPAETGPAGSRWSWWIAGGLLSVHAILAWLARAPGVTTWNDDALYLLLARSLRSLHYTDIFFQGAPFHSQYPPMYPAWLALLSGVVGERTGVLIAANIALSVAGLALFYDAARRYSTALGLLTLAVAALNPAIVDAAGMLSSEPLFMMWIGLSLSILARGSDDRRSGVWAGAAAIAAALTRTAGVTLIAAVMIHWLTRRQYRPAAWLGLAAALTVGTWLAWTVWAPSQVVGRSYVADATSQGQPYVDVLQKAPSSTPGGPAAPPAPALPTPLQNPGAGLLLGLAARVVRNLLDYTTATIPVALALPTVRGTVIDNVGWLIGLVLFVVAGLWTMRRWWPAGSLALVTYGALLAIWPYVISRYLTPVLPLILVTWFAGATAVSQAAAARLRRQHLAFALPALLGIAMLIGGARETGALIGASSACDRARPRESAGCFDREELSFFAGTVFIAQSTPDSARFLTAKEATFYYYTGRHALPVRAIAGAPAADLRAYLDRTGTDYVFLSHLLIDEWALAPALQSLCDSLDLVKSWGATAVLLKVPQRTQETGTGVGGKDSAACEAIQVYSTAPWGTRGPGYAEDRLRKASP